MLKLNFILGAAMSASLVPAATNAELEEQVRQAETGFAKSMADRDRPAFASFLAPDSVFMNGPRTLRGSVAVAEGWARFFEGPAAPFSWAPEIVVVLESGSLALSTGPVRDPSGKRIGTFNSVWRREANGSWKVVLDRGCPPCNCGSAPAPR
jgi:ketosteroid isomerase-like protein